MQRRAFLSRLSLSRIAAQRAAFAVLRDVSAGSQNGSPYVLLMDNTLYSLEKCLYGAGILFQQAGAMHAGTRLPFEDGSFDIVVFTLFAHNFSDEACTATLAEARRVGTRLLLADYCLPGRNMHYPAYWAMYAAAACGGLTACTNFRNFMRRGALFGLCEREGFYPVMQRDFWGGCGAALLLE